MDQYDMTIPKSEPFFQDDLTNESRVLLVVLLALASPELNR